MKTTINLCFFNDLISRHLLFETLICHELVENKAKLDFVKGDVSERGSRFKGFYLQCFANNSFGTLITG